MTCTQTSHDEFIPCWNTGYGSYGWRIGAQVLSLGCIGITASSITFKLKNIGSPSGTCYAKIYDSTAVLKCTLGSKVINTISTDGEDITFNTPDTTYTLQANDYVVLESDNGGSNASCVAIAKIQPNPDDTLYKLSTYTGSFGVVSTQMVYITLGSTPPPASSTTVIPPPPAYVRL